MKLKVIITALSLFYAISSNGAGQFQPMMLPYNSSSNESDKYNFEEEITIFIKAEKEPKFSQKIITTKTNLVLSTEGSLIKPLRPCESEIEFGRDDIEPDDTDSIMINGRVGLPFSETGNWHFEIEKGFITIYSAHPTEHFDLHYKIGTSDKMKTPSDLQISSTSKIEQFFSKIPATELADSLVAYPRIFSFFPEAPVEAMKYYNKCVENNCNKKR